MLTDDVRAVLAGERRAAVACGDCRELLPLLPDGCVQCVVTSPPYYALRDYGTGVWEGGSADCDHAGSRPSRKANAVATSTLGGSKETCHASIVSRSKCGRCGAVRTDRQIGLEENPSEYVAAMVGVFREVRRVLRDDGTLFLNVGDSYCGSGMTGGTNSIEASAKRSGRMEHAPRPLGGCKPKDLFGIPWHLAFALRDDGWYLRQDIIWAKSSPMPESITDRCTKGHEYLFLLTKKPIYYYDAEAIKERSVDPESAKGRNVRGADKFVGQPGSRTRSGFQNIAEGTVYATRNRRSVWTIAGESFSGSHFAVMPTKLVAPCVLAGTSERGCCPSCGAGWVRVTERTKGDNEATRRPKRTAGMSSRTSTLSLSGQGSKEWAERGSASRTTGWRQGCDCPPHEPRPCLVLDPFGGAGTVPMVANLLGRRGLALELNPAYAEMARARIAAPDADFSPTADDTPDLFAGVGE